MKQIILFFLVFIFIPFCGYGQLDSLDGYWVRIEKTDTIILAISNLGSKKKKTNRSFKLGLQKSSNPNQKSVYYFSSSNDSLIVLDAYGNQICKSLNFSISTNDWKINGECNIQFSRITKNEFKMIERFIESKGFPSENYTEINKKDYSSF